MLAIQLNSMECIKILVSKDVDQSKLNQVITFLKQNKRNHKLIQINNIHL